MTNSPPVIVLAFANDRSEASRYLVKLEAEAKDIRKSLETAERDGLCKLELLPYATLDDILDLLEAYQKRNLANRIAIFHFGGHANDYSLLFESADRLPARVGAADFARLLGELSGLKLVFLNGCSTLNHATLLRDAGIPAAIVTDQSIDDATAAEFARRFYSGLASGLSLCEAFSRSTEAVRVSRRGRLWRRALGETTPTRDLLPAGRDPDSDAAEVPWTIAFRSRSKSDETTNELVNLPDLAGKPLALLPPCADRAQEDVLPPRPFMGLDWYGEKDMSLFFGRGHAIRRLYDLIVRSTPDRIVLFHGQSGVGKSSMLSAGLVPRLRCHSHVVYDRRHHDGLAVTLSRMLVADGVSDIRTRWLEIEQVLDKPVVVILDQVEEVFTQHSHRDEGGPFRIEREMAEFIAVLQSLFARPDTQPRGRLVLGFRKDHLPEIQQVLDAARLSYIPEFLEPLSTDDIVEIVMGPTSDPRLMDRYRLSVDHELAEKIAFAMRYDLDSAVGPPLQILLSRMWDLACERDATSPVFDSAVFEAVKQEGYGQDDFLDRQLREIGRRLPEVAKLGLDLDILAFHVSDATSAQERLPSDLAMEYSHCPELVTELVQLLKDLAVLVDPASKRPDRRSASRLMHDTLAPVVRRRFDESYSFGQRARRILEYKRRRHGDSAAGLNAHDSGNMNLLDRTELEVVQQGEMGMRVRTPNESQLVAASVRKLQADRARRVAFAAVGAAAVVLISALAVKATREATISRARELSTNSQVLRSEQPVEAAKSALAAVGVLRDLENWRLFPPASLRTVVDQALLDITHDLGGLPVMTSGDTRVAFTADGRLITVGIGADSSRPGSLRLWNGQDPTILVADLGKDAGIGSPLSFAVSPHGRWLAVGMVDGRTWVWDLVTLDTMGPLAGAGDRVYDLAFSGDDRWLVAGDYRNKVRVWDMTDLSRGTNLPTDRGGHQEPVLAIAMSTNGYWVASGGGDIHADEPDVSVRLWDLRCLNAAPIVLPGRHGIVKSLAFSPIDRWLAGATEDGVIALWSLDDLKADPRLLASDNGVEASALAFSSDGRWLAAGNDKGTVRLWDMAASLKLRLLPKHADGVWSIAFSPNGRWMATGSLDGTARVWDTSDWQEPPRVLRGHNGRVWSVAFAPGAVTDRIATGADDGTSRVWGLLATDAEPRVLEGHRGGVTALAYAPSGKWIASGTEQGAVQRWDLQNLSRGPSTIAELHGLVLDLAFSHDGVRLAAVGEDHKVVQWTDHGGELTGAPLASQPGTINTVAYSPEGSWLVGGANDGSVWRWDIVHSIDNPQPLARHGDDQIIDLAFSCDGRSLAGAISQGVLLWDMTDPGAVPVQVPNPGNEVWSIAYAPRGCWLATGSNDGALRSYHLGNVNAEPSLIQASKHPITKIVFSPEGRLMAVTALDPSPKVWSAMDLSADPRVLSGHHDSVNTADFSPDGRSLATGSTDGSIRVWILDQDLLVRRACKAIGRHPADDHVPVLGVRDPETCAP